MRLLSLTFLLLLAVAAVQCWWPWGGDEEEEVKEVEKEEEEGFREQLERDLAGVGQEVVFESDHPADSIKQEEGDLVEEKEEKEEVKEEVKEEESWKEEAWESWNEEKEELSESDEANIAALLETPELARKLDRKAFEEKLDEVPLKSTKFVLEALITMYQ